MIRKHIFVASVLMLSVGGLCGMTRYDYLASPDSSSPDTVVARAGSTSTQTQLLSASTPLSASAQSSAPGESSANMQPNVASLDGSDIIKEGFSRIGRSVTGGVVGSASAVKGAVTGSASAVKGAVASGVDTVMHIVSGDGQGDTVNGDGQLRAAAPIEGTSQSGFLAAARKAMQGLYVAAHIVSGGQPQEEEKPAEKKLSLDDQLTEELKMHVNAAHDAVVTREQKRVDIIKKAGTGATDFRNTLAPLYKALSSKGFKTTISSTEK